MSANFEIKKDTIIADIISRYPDCIEILEKHNMPCKDCMGSITDTLEEGALMHDVNIDKIISELNTCICCKEE